MFCWKATEVVRLKSKIYKVILLCILVHLTSQTNYKYVGNCCNTSGQTIILYNTSDGTHGPINKNSVSLLCECLLDYSHICLWIHNRYIFEYWRAKQSFQVQWCCINNKEACLGENYVLKYRAKEKEDLQNNPPVEAVEWTVSRENYSEIPIELIVSPVPDELYTSVWCHSSPESGLRCQFHNLHYSTHYKEFIFVLSPHSIIYGIDDIKSLQTKLFLSSVTDHNAFPFHVVVVLQDIFMSSYTSRVINGKSFFLARFKPDNLQHVFHDDLIPLYFSMKEMCSGNNTCLNKLMVVFTDKNERNMYWEFYRVMVRKILFLSELESEDSQVWYCFKDAHFGVNKMSVWYQYGFGKPQGPQLTRTFSGHLLRQFADFMRKKLQVKTEESRMKTIVVLSRKHNRKLLNEEDLSVLIKNHLQTQMNEECDVNIMSLEENSVSEIIYMITRTQLLVGIHGASLILGIFLPPSSVLVEVWPYGVNPDAAKVYRTMCDLRDFKVTYISWVNEDVVNTVPHPEYPTHLGGLGHLSSRDRTSVMKGLHEGKIEFLVCCDSTEWLFRIYQDTIVCLTGDNTRLKSVPFIDVLARVQVVWKENVRSSQTDYSLIFQLYPSKVEKLTWTLQSNSQFKLLILEWEDPWNLMHLTCDRIFFEVILLVDGDGEARTYFVDSGRYTKELPSVVEGVNVWITCVCDDVEGPVLYTKCNM